jgi:integration host factor subunit beta
VTVNHWVSGSSPFRGAIFVNPPYNISRETIMLQHGATNPITRGDIVVRLSKKLALDLKTSEEIVKHILDRMSQAIADHERIEIRGFGSFEVKHRTPRQARNPKTGEIIQTKDRYTVHFKPGKELRERVDLKKPL